MINNHCDHGHDPGVPHDHEHEDSALHDHDHGEIHHHDHGHTHDPARIRAVINRISRAGGHLESVKRMLEDGRDCSEVLIQLAAVRAEINNAGKALLKEHMEHCIVEAVEENDTEALSRVREAIDKFMK